MYRFYTLRMYPHRKGSRRAIASLQRRHSATTEDNGADDIPGRMVVVVAVLGKAGDGWGGRLHTLLPGQPDEVGTGRGGSPEG